MWNVYYILNNEKAWFAFDEHEDIDAAFTLIRQKSGVYIDLYSDCNLYPDHQKILVEQLKAKRGHEAVIKFFEKTIELDEVVYFFGQ